MIGNYTGRKGELNFESDFVELLTQSGWEAEVLKNATELDLQSNLRTIINENNVDKLGLDSPLTDGEFSQIMERINSFCSSPVSANIFLNGKQVVITSELNRNNYQVGDEIYLFIFDSSQIAGGKSRYQIAEQVHFETSSKYNDRRNDIMLLINGLPVIHIELKASGHSLEEGTAQIQKYMNEGVFKGIFSLIQVFFVATPEDVIYFANTYPKLNSAFFFHWGDKANKPIHDWQELIASENQILSIPEAHQLVGYYTTASVEKDSNGCIEKIDDGVLMVARSYQVIAIRAIMSRVKKQHWGTHTQLGGYVWGTTGCGKTLTSYKSGQLIVDKNFVDKVVFVVDRKELDEQSFKEYAAFARDGEPIKRTYHTRDLFKALLNDSDRLIITSIQKLSRVNKDKLDYVSEEDIEKIKKKRIVFITDEAHRSQFGEMHEMIKTTFETALFIGFTGTPIFSENDKANGMTSEVVFGDCLAVYSIASGIRDRNVLGFDPKMVKTFQDEDLRNAVACDKAKVRSQSETLSDPEKYKIYKKYHELSMVEIEALLPKKQYDCEGHRREVVKDILGNWDILSNKGGRIRFHALLATNSIPEAIKYYRLLKTSGLKVTAIFDPNLNGDSQAVIEKEEALIEIVDDYNMMFGTGNIINRDADPKLKSFKSDVTARLSHKTPYKNISDNEMLDLVIVVDQLLTGFDSKYVNTLYLDKILETDALIQAISRTNRVLDFDEKPWGIFRYYRMPYTMTKNIEEALRLYCEGGEDSGVIVANIDSNLERANELYSDIKKIFDSAGVKDFMNLPINKADCKKFQLVFRELSQVINGMKLQGMKWKDNKDKYVKKLDVCQKWIDNKTRIFDVLYMRYKDLFQARNKTSEPSPHPGYSLMAKLSEVEKDKIDADYLESHFKTTVPILVGDYEEDKKDEIIAQFQTQIALLSSEQQKFANIILDDIRNGILEVDENTSFRELIAKYQEDAKNQEILDFANKYGLDSTLLYKAYYNRSQSNRILEINKLKDTCDIEKVIREFGGNKLTAKGKLLAKIKEFVGIS